MPISFNQEMMRGIIMDHFASPRNNEDIKDDSRYITIHMDSASCIDDIYIHALIKDDVIVSLKWHYTDCCAISRASTSIMSELVEGKTISQALHLAEEFDKMMKEIDYDEDLLLEANCFKNTPRQPSRITCANIGWRGLILAIEEKNV